MGEKGVRLMIAGGGTGGHIYPAIAIAQEWVRRDRSRKAVFVGTQGGLEKTIVPRAGYPIEFISVGGLKVDLTEVEHTLAGFTQALQVIARHRPNVVLGVGGYASGPVLLAARLRAIPTAILEQNAFPGVTNRVLAKFVNAVAVAFPDSGSRLKRSDAIVTGNPIRAEFFTAKRQPTTGNRQRLLVFGGSQGSHVLNEAMIGALLFLARLKDRLDIVHQTGTKELDNVRQAYRASAFPNARVVPYLDPIAEEIAAADLVVSRAGAMTIGELAAVGRAAILVPFAAATNNHQELNARAVEQAGGAIVITESQLTPERLAMTINDVINDPQRAVRMGAAARSLAAPDATKKIVDLLEKIHRNE